MRLHVRMGHNNVYEIVVHAPAPAGNNSAGFSWAACIVQAYKPVSVMTSGNGPGQTTTPEINAVAAGTTLEGFFTFYDDPTMTTAQRDAALDALATQTVLDLQAKIVDELKWFGATRT